jgi:hypothetical protein
MSGLYKLDDRQHATILAALRFWQEREQTDERNRSGAIADIATNGGTLEPLRLHEIDDLCESFNGGACDQVDALVHFAVDDSNPYVRAARERTDEELEIDDRPLLSKPEDEGGAWVSAWMWVTDEEAGIEEDGGES